MDLARYVVDAVVLEGSQLPGGRSGPWGLQELVGKLVGRFREGGYEAIAPAVQAPLRVPHRTPEDLEDEIVALRKQLSGLGVDAGAATIAYHLARRHDRVPSISTIWRVLRRRGFVTPQPHKRPKSSWNRFEADLPNECWQSDVTHWRLAEGTEVEITTSSTTTPGSRSRPGSPSARAPRRRSRCSWLRRAVGSSCGAAHRQRLRLHDLAPGGPNVMQTELLGSDRLSGTRGPTTLRPAGRWSASTRR